MNQKLYHQIIQHAYAHEHWYKEAHNPITLQANLYRALGKALPPWVEALQDYFNPGWWEDTKQFVFSKTPPSPYYINKAIERILKGIAHLTHAIECACCLNELGTSYDYGLGLLISLCEKEGIDWDIAVQATPLYQEACATIEEFEPGYECKRLESFAHLYGVAYGHIDGYEHTTWHQIKG